MKIRYLYIYELAIHMFRHHCNLLPLDLPSISFINQSNVHNNIITRGTFLIFTLFQQIQNWLKIPSQLRDQLSGVKFTPPSKIANHWLCFKTCLKKYIFSPSGTEPFIPDVCLLSIDDNDLI